VERLLRHRSADPDRTLTDAAAAHALQALDSAAESGAGPLQTASVESVATTVDWPLQFVNKPTGHTVDSTAEVTAAQKYFLAKFPFM